VREFECIVLSDGCAAFSQTIHDAALEGLWPVAAIRTIARTMTMMVSTLIAGGEEAFSRFPANAAFCRAGRALEHNFQQFIGRPGTAAFGSIFGATSGSAAYQLTEWRKRRDTTSPRGPLHFVLMDDE
jgi:hypothetical protein